MPQVSVLMSVYNGAKYLREAVDSILQQTFGDFEFIIVDDGSTDMTPDILDSYADPRFVRLRNPQNIGLTRSLNRGLEVVRGQYIARMDADDIAMPQRLAQQVEYMNAHREIGLLCGDIRLIDADGQLLNGGKSVYPQGATHHFLTWSLLWINPIPHMTVMLRKSVLDVHGLTYLPEYNTAEDHELWGRLGRYTRLLRLPEVWAQHRIVATSVSRSRRAEQLATQYRVVAREIKTLLGEDAPEDALKTLFEMIYHEQMRTRCFADAAAVIAAAYRAYLSRRLTPIEQRQIQGEAVGYLLKLARLAPLRQRGAVLWRLRGVSRREFYSRNALRLLLGIK